MLLAGQTVIITGVGGGVGRECLTSALRDGADVVIAARTQETLDSIAADLDPRMRISRGGVIGGDDGDRVLCGEQRLEQTGEDEFVAERAEAEGTGENDVRAGDAHAWT